MEALREALKVRLQQLEEPGRGFLFSLRWTGPLILDANFTDSSRLARLEIVDGCFEYRRPVSSGEKVPKVAYIHFQCQGGCVRDTRQDADGLLIDLPCNQEHLGLQVRATMPEKECTQITVDLSQCLVHIPLLIHWSFEPSKPFKDLNTS